MVLNCLECGACCKYLFIPLRTKTREERIFYQTRGFRLEGDLAIEIKPCPHLKSDNKCDIYETRPLSCRVFRVGGKDCWLCRKLTEIASYNKSNPASENTNLL